MWSGLHMQGCRSLDIYSISMDTVLPLPLAESGISAGFPSPAQDYLDLAIDLNKELIRNPSSTFYARVKGESMQGAGIDHGDLLVVDRSVSPSNGKIAVCFIDGEFTVKRIKTDVNCCWLMPENPTYQPIRVTESNQFLVWGVVIYLIKAV